MKYRPEIDGLRALAVVPVILFHAGMQFFSGGFVGVDVFFVISGYLITSIILKEKEAGTFSLKSFYERRIRRILPLLFFIMLCCIPFAWAWMMPTQLKSFAKSLYSVVFFASNIQFMDEVDYFADLSEDKPLLHTWSLAVEEQYYILFPLFIMMFWRFGKQRLVQLILFGSLVSFALAEYGWRHEPVMNYYLVLTRAWEIFAGSICAFIMFDKKQKPDEALSLIGLGMLILSIIVFNKATPWPSFLTLLPIIGTCLLILYMDQKTLVGRVFSTKGFVTIGLMSYGLYLWHVPLFAFARIRSFGPPETSLLLLLSLVALGLSYFTWKYVEAPFRDRSESGMPTKKVMRVMGMTGAFLVVLGLIGDKTDGMPQRFSSEIHTILEAPKGDTSGCHNKFKYDGQKIRAGEVCTIGAADAFPHIAVIGDSHASRITDALAENLKTAGQAALTYNASWCVPLLDLYSVQKKKRHCRDFITASFEATLNNPQIKTVILYGQWANVPWGQRWGEDEVATYGFADRAPERVKDNTSAFRQSLRHTMEALKASNKNIMIIGPIPEFNTVIPYTLAKLQHFGKGDAVKHQLEDSLLVTWEDYERRNKEVLLAFDQIAQDYDVAIINPYHIYCGEGFCQYETPDGTPFYEDGSHLTRAGSQPLVNAMMRAF